MADVKLPAEKKGGIGAASGYLAATSSYRQHEPILNHFRYFQWAAADMTLTGSVTLRYRLVDMDGVVEDSGFERAAAAGSVSQDQHVQLVSATWRYPPWLKGASRINGTSVSVILSHAGYQIPASSSR